MIIKIIDAGRRDAPTSGYGLMSYQFGERLKAYKHNIHYFDEEPAKESDIWLWMRPPHYVKEKYFDENKFNVFYTMHEQETFEGWKKDWPVILNKCKAVIVPTEWNREVFIKNGVTVPVYVCPLGVDERVFRGYKNRRFSILSMFDSLGSSGSREDWRENISSYYETFYDNHNEDVLYGIKSWRTDYYSWIKWRDNHIKEMNYDIRKLPEVQIFEIDLVPEDLNLFYSKYNCFLKNSSGEGWSLPTIEALSCGLRIISRRTPAMVYLNENNTDFFNNRNELKDKIWENWRRYRKSKTHIGQWSWRNSTKTLNEILNQIYIQG